MDIKDLEKRIRNLEEEVENLKSNLKSEDDGWWIKKSQKAFLANEKGEAIIKCSKGGLCNWKEEEVIGNIGIRRFKYCTKCRQQHP